LIINSIYETKIFCHCSLFPSWSGQELISTPVDQWLPDALRDKFPVQFIIHMTTDSSQPNNINLNEHISTYHLKVTKINFEHSIVKRKLRL